MNLIKYDIRDVPTLLLLVENATISFNIDDWKIITYKVAGNEPKLLDRLITNPDYPIQLISELIDTYEYSRTKLGQGYEEEIIDILKKYV